MYTYTPLFKNFLPISNHSVVHLNLLIKQHYMSITSQLKILKERKHATLHVWLCVYMCVGVTHMCKDYCIHMHTRPFHASAAETHPSLFLWPLRVTLSPPLTILSHQSVAH